PEARVGWAGQFRSVLPVAAIGAERKLGREIVASGFAPNLPSQECARTSHPGLIFATAPPCGPTVTLFRDPERPRLIRHETRERTMSLKDKTIVVTGGSRGLGLGLVEALVDQGAKVTVVARDPTALAAVEQKLSVAVISADVTDEGAAKRILADVRPEV